MENSALGASCLHDASYISKKVPLAFGMEKQCDHAGKDLED
jgi:hypothetical protein